MMQVKNMGLYKFKKTFFHFISHEQNTDFHGKDSGYKMVFYPPVS